MKWKGSRITGTGWGWPKVHRLRTLQGRVKMTEMLSDEEILDELQRSAFGYFTNTVNTENGLIPDNTRPDSPSSIAAVGLALASYPVGVERGYIAREEAVQLTLAALRFFWNSPQGPAPDATGYQ